MKEKIADFFQSITPENASTSNAKTYVTSGQPIEGIDYYLDDESCASSTPPRWDTGFWFTDLLSISSAQETDKVER